MGKSEVKNSELFKANERTERAGLDGMKVKMQQKCESWADCTGHLASLAIRTSLLQTLKPQSSLACVNKPVFTSGAHETPGRKLITEP